MKEFTIVNKQSPEIQTKYKGFDFVNFKNSNSGFPLTIKMKKTFSFFMVFLFLCVSLSSKAQVSTYSFSTTSGAYTDIGTGDTTVAYATTTTTSGPLSMDDVTYPNNTLPFTFTFKENNYTNVIISDNGFITFGATDPGGTTYSPISGTGTYDGVIAPFAGDRIGNRGITATTTNGNPTLTAVASAQFVGLETGRIITGTGIPASTTILAFNQGAGTITLSANATASGTVTCLVCSGSIRRSTTGSVGSRVHIIQYKGIRPYTTTANANYVEFQIKLYETLNKIEIVYGQCSNSVSASGQVGMRGSVNTDFNNRSTSANWSATSAGALNNASCSMNGLVIPASGLIFNWNPLALFANDVGVFAILNPIAGQNNYGSSITPRVKIKNYGTASQTFNTTCTITPGGYSNSASVVSLTAGDTVSKTFANISPSVGILYTVTVYTSLAGDANKSNDTLKQTSSFVHENYGNDSGYFYANSLATNQPSYPTYNWKDTTGNISLVVNTVQVSGTLVGTLDDGYFKLSLKNILLASGQDTTGKHLKYDGNCYDSIFPGTNGIVGLTEAYGSTSISTFNVSSTAVARNCLLPFWRDQDLRFIGTGAGSNRLSYKLTGNQLIITYDKIGFYNSADASPNWSSYQVILEIDSGCGGANSNFRYTYTDTTTGQSSGTFVNNYINSYNAVPPATTTFGNFISGFSLNGAPIAYGGYVSGGPLNVKRPIYNLTTIYNRITNKGLAVEFGIDANDLNKFNDLFEVSNLYAKGSIPIKIGMQDTISFRIVKYTVGNFLIHYTVKINNRGNGINLFTSDPENILLTTPDTIVYYGLPKFYSPTDNLIIVEAVPGAFLNDNFSAGGDTSSKQYCQNITNDTYNYADPCLNDDGGFGFQGSTGNIVAGFRNNDSNSMIIGALQQSFFDSVGGGNKPYNIVIYGDSTNSKPGKLLYKSPNLLTPAGTGSPQVVTYNLNVTIPQLSRFYVGYRQTSANSIKASFQSEIPIRKKSFFFTGSDTTNWYDFSDSAKNFRMDMAVIIKSKTLNLKLTIQGLVNGPGSLRVRDTVEITIRKSYSPYDTIQRRTVFLDSAHNGSYYYGFTNAQITSLVSGTPYYIVVKNRKIMESWSNPVSASGDTLKYDFTTSISQTYGNNAILTNGVPSIYSGDITSIPGLRALPPQDGFIDLADVNVIFNDASAFTSGPNLVTDLNWDGFVDLTDLTIVYNNSSNFVQRIAPPGAKPIEISSSYQKSEIMRQFKKQIIYK